MVSAQSSLIPFDEIVPGASVRLVVIKGTQYLSARDVIMHVCGKNKKDAGEVWRNLSDSKKKEIQDQTLNFKFPGKSQHAQPVITFPGALKMIMFLPGEGAKKHRPNCVKILTRHFAGDPSLIKEIAENGHSGLGSAQQAISLIPFDEVVPGATVRLAVIEGTQYLSVRDVIMHVCGKNANNAVDTWRTLSETKKKDLVEFLGMCQLLKNSSSSHLVCWCVSNEFNESSPSL
jgi:hypothetical protein